MTMLGYTDALQMGRDLGIGLAFQGSVPVTIVYCHEVLEEIAGYEAVDPNNLVLCAEALELGTPSTLEELVFAHLDSLATLNYALVRQQDGYL